ncbi:MAG: carboxylating nicotinate-nucleotide diphosphorylase [Deltaproteobacteria bacterium]
MNPLVDELISLALREDLGPTGDVTSAAALPASARFQGRFVAREPLVVSGLDVAARVFERLDPALAFRPLAAEGDALGQGAPHAEVTGDARALLAGERTALNFLQRLCGVATLTSRFVEQLSGTGCRLLDTRKTTPGHRLLEKAAVRAGGGQNHRMGLFDGILLKDNHLAAAGGLRAAVLAARARGGALLRLEVEVDRLAQLDEALSLGVEIALCDNFALPELREAVARRNRVAPKTLLEASGGVRLDTVREIGRTGVDFVSAGVLTHGARAVDIGLDAS